MKRLLVLLMSVMLFTPVRVNAAVVEEKIIEPVSFERVISINSLTIPFPFLNEDYEEAVTMYTTCDLNVRRLPTRDSEIVDILADNSEVTVMGKFGDWTKIWYDEQIQYVWSGYLSTEKKVNEYLGRFKLTGYCNCSSCCGQWAGGPTSSGTMPVAGRTVAMGGVPFGTKLMINGHVYVVEDRGTPYGHIDIYHSSHSAAWSVGVQYADVYLVK